MACRGLMVGIQMPSDLAEGCRQPGGRHQEYALQEGGAHVDLDTLTLEGVEMSAAQEALVEDVERELDQVDGEREQGIDLLSGVDGGADLLDEALALELRELRPEQVASLTQEIRGMVYQEAVDGFLPKTLERTLEGLGNLAYGLRGDGLAAQRQGLGDDLKAVLPWQGLA
ncbi:hypothetical protein D3C87_1276800 [compost metagenome]